jgi:ATP-dependent DNA ligase
MSKTFVRFIEEAEAYSTKANKLAALAGLSETAKHLVFLCLSPYEVFGTKKFDKPKSYAFADKDEGQSFIKTLERMASRTITGNKAREELTCVLGHYTERTAEKLVRVLNKDLKCGIDTSVNKVYPGLIPTFDCMLASKLEDASKVKFPVIASTKLDGNRTIVIVKAVDDITYFSRSGKVSEHLTGLFDEELGQIFIANNRNPFMLDAETMGDNFTETMNAKGSGNDKAKAKLKLNAFDMMPLSEWEAQKSTVAQKVRTEILQATLAPLALKKIQIVDDRWIEDADGLQAFYSEVLAAGYEGLIIKDPEAVYSFDRGKEWQKYKPVITVDLTVVGFYEGRPGSKYVGTLGGLELDGEDENGKHIITNCGSGFTDEMRKNIWARQLELIGDTAEIQCQEICKSEANDAYSLRFPVFNCWRLDK